MSTRQVLPKINSAKCGIFFAARLSAVSNHEFHHKSTIIYHAKHHVLRAQIRKTPCKNAEITTQKKYE